MRLPLSLFALLIYISRPRKKSQFLHQCTGHANSTRIFVSYHVACSSIRFSLPGERMQGTPNLRRPLFDMLVEIGGVEGHHLAARRAHILTI